MNYILDGKTPVHEPDIIKWGAWMETANRSVDVDVVLDNIAVSTVFLGIDHNMIGAGPILFETMVFYNGDGRDQYRYSTWEEAEEGHKKVVEELKKNLN